MGMNAYNKMVDKTGKDPAKPKIIAIKQTRLTQK